MFLLLKGELGGIYSPLFYLTLPKNIKYGKKLKEIANINPTRNKPKFNADILVPYVGLPETDEYDNDVKVVLERPFVEVGGRNIIRKDDILFARIEPSVFNKKYIYVDDLKGFDFAFTSTEFYILESKTVLQKYLFYILFLDFVYNQVEGKTTGSTGRRRLDKGAFENIIIPSPPLETQQTIINIFENAYAKKKAKEAEAKLILDSIDGYLLEKLGITLPEKQENILRNRVFLRNISDLGGSRFDGYYHGEFFERLPISIKNGYFPTAKLEKLCLKITDGTHYTPTYVSSGIPFISVKNVRRSAISFEDIKYITEKEHFDLTKRAKPEPNDILLTKIGTIGLSAVIPEELPEFSIFVSLALIKPNKTMNSYFLSEVISSPIVKYQFERDLKGTGVPDLHLENICKVSIPLPPLEIQERIVAEINHRRKLAKVLQTEASELLAKAKVEVERMILGGGGDD